MEGGRFVELNLFSKLSSDEYLKLYNELGFNIKELTLEFSLRAENLLKTRKDLLEKILNKYKNLSYLDLILKSHIVVLEKNNIQLQQYPN